MAATKTPIKDLAPKKSPKGGRKQDKLAANDSITLVRAAKPKVKDLPPKGNPKGGKKQEKLSANDNLTLVRASTRR